MDHGRIVEHGTHQQLMAGSGLYKDLYEAQFAGREQVQAVPEPEL
jgi:ATP-binding cassette subfamily B protein